MLGRLDITDHDSDVVKVFNHGGTCVQKRFIPRLTTSSEAAGGSSRQTWTSLAEVLIYHAGHSTGIVPDQLVRASIEDMQAGII